VTALLTSTSGGGLRFACSSINFLCAAAAVAVCGPILLPTMFAWWKNRGHGHDPDFRSVSQPRQLGLDRRSELRPQRFAEGTPLRGHRRTPPPNFGRTVGCATTAHPATAANGPRADQQQPTMNVPPTSNPSPLDSEVGGTYWSIVADSPSTSQAALGSADGGPQCATAMQLHLSLPNRRLPVVLGELVRTTSGAWITHPPTRCPNGTSSAPVGCSWVIRLA
jgi:hypothetical protein